jgi:hypothetical protein
VVKVGAKSQSDKYLGMEGVVLFISLMLISINVYYQVGCGSHAEPWVFKITFRMDWQQLKEGQ